MNQEVPHIPCTSGERIRRSLTSPGLLENASGGPLHPLDLWVTLLGPFYIPRCSRRSQNTMDFKDKSMLLGYINLKISKWYASLRCPMLSKALEQYLTDRNK